VSGRQRRRTEILYQRALRPGACMTSTRGLNGHLFVIPDPNADRYLLCLMK